MIKKILGVLGLALLAVILWNYKLVYYALVQGKGQLTIVWKAKPVEAFLGDPATPDSIKQKLDFIGEVREFAINELGLNDTDNYTTMYDQQGKPILWVVTGCEPYAFEAKVWKFPIVGEMPYKGFFIQSMADKEMEVLKEEGYDVGVRTVGGWSTLGWFKDPILSNMLNRSHGDLANLIIHELVHATIFVKDSVEFNENLASFIGDEGAKLFLKRNYPDTYLAEYLDELTAESILIDHVLRGADKLDSLYHLVKADTSGRADLKQALIKDIINNMDTLALPDPAYLDRIKGKETNNTYFMSFLRYRSKQLSLQELYKGEFNENLTAFIQYLKGKHPFL